MARLRLRRRHLRRFPLRLALPVLGEGLGLHQQMQPKANQERGKPMTTIDDTLRIRELNDAFRGAGDGGRILFTAGVSGLGVAFLHQVLALMRRFDAFTPDNDPHKSMISGALRTKGRSSFGKSSTTTRLANSGPTTPPILQRRCAF